MVDSRIIILDGNPTDVEIAAVVTALDARRRDERSTRRSSPRRPSRWIRAARLEASGHPPIESPTGFSR
jgi:hypothetical protein